VDANIPKKARPCISCPVSNTSEIQGFEDLLRATQIEPACILGQTTFYTINRSYSGKESLSQCRGIGYWGTCPRQVFENTNREFIWALRHARIFYHIFRESLPYPCFRILLACNEYSRVGLVMVMIWKEEAKREGRSEVG